MTSIAATSLQQYSSPRDLLQNELSSEISTGTISSADGSALSSALDDIDTAMQSDRASATGGQPSPGDMKKKIDGLIASEVQNGKLTDDQATELQNVFAKAFQNGGPGGPGGPGGAGGGTSSAPSSDSSGTQSSSSSDNTTQLLQDFLKLLQDSQGTTGYDASGDAQSKLTSLLVNYQT